MKKYIFKMVMKVRDYECDLQGIVNNANYLHYMEHTRHEFLLRENVSFSKLHDEGTDCVVARMETAYKLPLRSGDSFVSCLNLRKEGVKYVFCQDIYRLSDMKLAVRSRIDTVCVVDGRLGNSEQLDNIFKPYFAE